MLDESQPVSFAARKKRLLIENARYRAGVIQSRQVVRVNLRPEVVAKSAASHLTAAVYDTVHEVLSIDGLKQGGFQKILPFVISAVAALSRRSMLRPLARGALLVAGLSTIAVLVFRNKKEKRSANRSLG